MALLSAIGSACYVYQPIAAPATSGMRVAVDLSDRGRVALADSLGGSVQRVEGTVQSASDSILVLRVASVQFLNGQVSHWTNEPITFARDHFQSVRERRFSRQRTMLATGGVVGAVMAFVAGRALLGSGHDGRDDIVPPPPSSGQ